MMAFGLLLGVGLIAALVGGLDSDDGTEGDVSSAVTEGSQGDDLIFGSEEADIIDGAAGNDDITGRGGLDFLFGNDGDDLIKGRGGDDILQGGDGNDSLRGGENDDLLIGSAGDDQLFGNEGNDTLIGADVTSRDLTVDDILAAARDPGYYPDDYTDVVPAETEANYMDGGEGNDLFLVSNNDTAVGGEGNDRFEIGEWVADGREAPLIADFDEDHDLLVLRYATEDGPPTVTLDTVGHERHVFADGQLVAVVHGDGSPLFPRDIRLAAV